MARPTKQEHEKRTDRFNLRFTTAEGDYLRQQAKIVGLDPHDYARKRCLGFVVQPPAARSDAALVSELHRIGVNVNQLARAQNADRNFVGDWQAIEGEMRRLIAKVAKAYGS